MRDKSTLCVSIITLVLFFIPFLWFDNSQILLGGEAYTTVNYEQFFLRNLSFWNHSYGLGLPNISIIPQFYHLLTYLLTLIFSIALSQKMILGLILSMSFLSCFYFLKHFFSPTVRIPIILGALFYVFNPFFASMFGWIPTYGFLFIFTPLVLLKCIKIIEGKGDHITYALLYIFGFCYAGVAMNLALYSFVYILVLLFGLRTFFKMDKKPLVAKRIMLSILVLLTSSSYWLLPFTKTFKEIFGGASIYAFNFSDISLYRFPIFNSFTLNEYYWFTRRTIGGDYFYPYSRWYEYPAQLIVALIVLCVLFAFLQSNKKKQQKYSLFFFLIFLGGVFLSKGTAAPLGELYKFSLKFIKYFGIYRASDIKFPFFVVFALAYLIPYSLSVLANMKRFARIKNQIFVGFFLGIIFLGVPFILGSVIPSRQATINSLKVQIPEYWIQAMLNMPKMDDGRILVFPKNYSPLDNYIWGYKGVYLPYSFVDTPIVGYSIGYGSSIEESRFNAVNIIFSLYEKGDFISMQKALSLFNIRTILLRNDFDLAQNALDVDQKVDSHYSKDVLQKKLDNFFPRHSSYNQLVFYSVPDAFFLGQIYIPREVQYLNGKRLEVLQEAISNKTYEVGTALFIDAKRQFPMYSNTNITGLVRYNKKSPAEYVVEVTSSEKVIPLVFGESYSEGWKINVEGVSRNVVSTLNSSHEIVNGYANSWIIDIESICLEMKNCKIKNGQRTILLSIYYGPQRQFIFGLAVTLIGMLISIIIVFNTLLKYRFMKKV